MKKIALVDDSSFDQALMSNHLQKKDYITESFRSGEDFLFALETTGFDLVVLDVIMPAMNGLEVLQNIRKNFNQMTLPVVMLSAIDSYDYVQESVLYGANEYMIKPLDFRLFDLRIKTHLDLKDLFEANKINQKQQNIRSIVEQYHHELLNPLTIASNALDDLSHVLEHESLKILKHALDRIEDTIRKIYQAYKKDLE